jgi:hypothetical protein
LSTVPSILPINMRQLCVIQIEYEASQTEKGGVDDIMHFWKQDLVNNNQVIVLLAK